MGGIVLVVVGLGGMVGILGPAPETSIFGSRWWFDDTENWAHLILGVTALIVVFAVPSLAAPVTLLVGVIALLVGVSGFVRPDFLGANLENPADNILHLAVGVWALLSWMQARGKSMSPMNSGGM